MWTPEKRPWHNLKKLLAEDVVVDRIHEMADFSARKHAMDKPVYVRIQNGADYFADTFEKQLIESGLDFETGEITVKSMDGAKQGEIVLTEDYSGPDLRGRNLVILEDIVDSGNTIKYLLEHFRMMSPAMIEVIALYSKPDDRKVDVPLEDVGFNVFGFVVGSNLDYDGLYREKKGLYLTRFFPNTLKKLLEYIFPKRPIRNTSPSTA
jgi:hypoxanthine phosphoribosyltransferase